jgi:hypothetical protein
MMKYGLVICAGYDFCREGARAEERDDGNTISVKRRVISHV